MATKKYTVPNWGQATIARAVGLEPQKVAVRMEDETLIVFLQYMPRKEFFVNKKTGKVTQM